jgi:hypothetical protein
MMPVEMEEMWQLSADGRSICMSLPGLPIEGTFEPLRISVDFDADVVDRMIERLKVLRAHVKLGPSLARKWN